MGRDFPKKKGKEKKREGAVGKTREYGGQLVGHMSLSPSLSDSHSQFPPISLEISFHVYPSRPKP